MACGGTGGGASCSARSDAGRSRTSPPLRSALRPRATIRVRIAPLPLQTLQELPRVRRLGRLRVLLGKLVQNRPGLVLSPEDPQAPPPLPLCLRRGIARRILHRDCLEELQRAVAVAA